MGSKPHIELFMFCLKLRSRKPKPTCGISPIGVSIPFPTPSLPILQRPVMFSKAVREHTSKPKPLAANPGHINVLPPAYPNQTAGAKRKLEMARPQQTPIATLHSAVFFDENDFENDEDIDLDSSSNISSSVNAFKPLSTTDSQVKFPDIPPPFEPSLPPANPPAPQDSAPASSIPLPWSSSPPAHLAPPPNPPPVPKRRTLPWSENGTKDKRVKTTETKETGIKNESQNIRTPSNKRQDLPWNTSMSAVKESQKELRKQQKTRITDDKKTGVVGQRAPKVPSIFLSEEQRRVLDAIVTDSKSIFFTGSAGTGKSVLMRETIRKLREKYKKEPDRVAVTASTGLAACNIEGVTLHSFAGVGLGKENVQDLVKKVGHP